MSERNRLSLDSWVVSGGRSHEPGDPLNIPMITASNYLRGAELVYSREDGTPTVLALESLMGGLEGGSAVAFSSGMAAVAAVFDPIPVGSRVVIPDDCYQGVTALALEGEERGRWSVERLSLTDIEGWQRACETADLIWLESPSNPLLTVADIPAICAVPRKAGSVVAVDNTFATPICQRPIESGADIVMHSATKFIGGHSDLLAGMLVAKSEETAARLRHTRTTTGATLGALETFLAIRGIRTLALRMERAQANALELARRLESHPDVEIVRYPGLESHPTHETARRTLDGFGAMMSFDVSGPQARATRVCELTELINHATSLGGVETTMEHRSIVPGQEHLPPTLIRLSVGIEGVDDLWDDLSQAIEESR